MSNKLLIVPVETAEERTKFNHFQWEVYKGDPLWCPPLLSEREEFLDPNRHPFHQHAKVRYFMAYRGDKPVGRIAGFINYRHNEYWNEKVGFFGLYEVLEDREASDALLRAAEDFVREEGMTAIRGPMNFSTNEECGLLVDGWNGPPVVMMTYNPQYYVDYIEGTGYIKAMNLFAYLGDMTHMKPDGTGINPKLLRAANRVRERYNITIRPINMKDFDAEKRRVKKIYNAAWSKNWGFVPLTDAELDHLGEALKILLDPKVTFFAEIEGEPIAFLLPFVDLCQPLVKAYPKPGTPEWITMLKLGYWWKVRRSVTTIRAAVGGIIEEYQGSGVAALLFLEGILAGVRQGYKAVEFSWVLETNIPMRQTAAIFEAELYRTYRIYEKTLWLED
ncbi:MAG: N-acetyltransferase [Anaerolineae bacterium]|nr:N-acetyltransferase [Anaerolineae bacterium]